MTINFPSSKIRISSMLVLLLMLFSLCGYFQYAIISFIIVIIHEISHSLVAILLGYKIEEIAIFPLGGVVKLNKLMGVNPQHEILIASVGPLSNIVMALIAYAMFLNFRLTNELMVYFIYANIIITITNLLPILPLDGGRIVRCYLGYLIGMKNSTRILITVSKFITSLLFIMGLYFMQYNILNLFISFTAVYLFKSIQKEKEMAGFVFIREITAKKQFLLNKGVIKTKQLVALCDTNINNVINKFRPQRYHFITVIDNNYNILGSLTESEIIDGLFKYGLDAKIEKLLINKKTW